MTESPYPSVMMLAVLFGVACSASAPAPAPAPAPPPPAAASAAPAPAPAASSAPSAAASSTPAPHPPPPQCDKNLLVELVGTPVWKLPGGTAIGFKTGMVIDADGAPKSFHKDDSKALDNLANAGKDGNWWALVTDTGKPDGKPLVQAGGDPAPGYFISATALFDKRKPARSPSRYVDASKIQYVALPPESKDWGVALGDFAVVLNARSGRIAFAILADVGPPAKLGEGSIALADALGIASSPKDGGLDRGVVYAIFLKSGNGAPRPAAEIDREGQRLFDAFGGRVALATCFR